MWLGTWCAETIQMSRQRCKTLVAAVQVEMSDWKVHQPHMAVHGVPPSPRSPAKKKRKVHKQGSEDMLLKYVHAHG